MKYKEYSSELWTAFHQTLDRVLKEQKNPVAAFDADGTLWDTDLGESFFDYQISKRLVPLPENPWEYYETLKKRNNDPRGAYLWLAQICEGLPLSQVQEWSKKSFQALHPLPLLQEQKKIIDIFHQKGVEVFIVTASIKWAVEPGAEFLGIDQDHVLGIETEVKDGIVTAQGKGIITYKEGKAEALLHRTQGRRPFFASGNSEGDIALLDSATDFQLAVSAASRDDKLFQSEEKLSRQAAQKNWWYHRFISG